MLALLLALSLSQIPQHRLFLQPNLWRQSGPAYAFFEFAPSSGAGMGTACACTTPTGAKGEAMTFTRAANGTCLKGGTTTGIANGDLVVCGVNEPRVMPGGDGSGGLGLLVEGARTNLMLRSEEFDNAAWLKANCAGGATAPTVTADQAVAPDGATTADRVQVPATTTAQASCVYQSATQTGNWSGSLFLKGNATTDTVDLAIYDNAASVYRCVTCSYNPTTWTRCLKENVAQGSVNATFIFGNLGAGSPFCHSTGQGAKDFFAWGAQAEVGAFASSYIVTTAAAVTRATETATFPAVTSVASAGSGAATVVALDTGAAGGHGILHMASTGALLYAKTTPAMAAYDGTTEVTRATTWSTQPHRYASSWTGSTLTVFDVTAGTSTAGAFDGAMGTTNICIGSGTGGTACGASALDGVVKAVCLDPSPTRCR